MSRAVILFGEAFEHGNRRGYRALRSLALGPLASLCVVAHGASPSAECTFSSQVAATSYASLVREGRLGEGVLETTAELASLVGDNAKDSIRPIGEQLTKEQLSRFEELRHRSVTIQLSQLIESKRQRDLKVIRSMVMAADRHYRFGAPMGGDGDVGAIAAAALELFAKDTSEIGLTERRTSVDCDVDGAVEQLEHEPLAKMQAADTAVGIANRKLEAIRVRYKHEGPVSVADLNPQDRAQYQQLSAEIIPSIQALEFVRMLERIRILEYASLQLYECSKEDVAVYGGDFEKVGRTIQARLRRKELGPYGDAAVSIWDRVNVLMPSDLVKQMNQSGKAETKERR